MVETCVQNVVMLQTNDMKTKWYKLIAMAAQQVNDSISYTLTNTESAHNHLNTTPFAQ